MLNIKIAAPENANLITHGGTFHADEAFATVILAKYLKSMHPGMAEITLARVNRVTEDYDGIIYDVGNGPYDHHQRGGNGFRGNGVPYAACGLVWRDFGPVLCERAGLVDPDKVWQRIDTMLVQGVDASDCGTLPPLEYPAHPIAASGIIAQFNPNWDEPNSKEDQDAAFLRAVAFAETIFENLFENVSSTVRAYSLVQEAVANSINHVAVLDKFMPWIEVVHDLSGKTGEVAEKARELYYVVYPALRGGYQWRAVPVTPTSFQQRNESPVEWHGLNGEELQKVSGIKTATFCHTNGFIGGADTKEDCILMATKAIKELN